MTPKKDEPRYDAGQKEPQKLDEEGRDLRFRETIPSVEGPNTTVYQDMAASAHDLERDPNAPARAAEAPTRRPEE